MPHTSKRQRRILKAKRMKGSCSSPQIVEKKIIEPPQREKRRPLYTSKSDEMREKQAALRRKKSVSADDLRAISGSLRSLRRHSQLPVKYGRRRTSTTTEHIDSYLDVAKQQLRRMSDQLGRTQLNPANRHHAASLSSLNEQSRVQFALSQTPPMAPSNFSPILQSLGGEHRGELDMAEKYNYDLSRAQLKASSRTSALLAGFAMVALVELQYDEDTPKPLLVLLGVVTSLLVSVHLLALMMSTCILPYMEATGCTQDSPHLRLKFYIDLSWLFSTCIGLLLFLVEIGIIFFVKFDAVNYRLAGYITTAMLIPVVVVFIVFSYLIHKSRVSHSLGRFKDKVDTMKQFLDVEAQMSKPALVKDI